MSRISAAHIAKFRHLKVKNFKVFDIAKHIKSSRSRIYEKLSNDANAIAKTHSGRPSNISHRQDSDIFREFNQKMSVREILRFSGYTVHCRTQASKFHKYRTMYRSLC